MSIFEGLEINQNVLEQTNPVFNTGKMTLFQLSASGNKDAAAIAQSLGLTLEETQNSKTTTASPEQMAAGMMTMETRYRVMGSLAEISGCDICIDLPCGYTPRAIEFARKGIRFIGMDLPATITEAEPAIMSLMTEEEKRFVKFCGVDATNYSSLEAALDGEEGSLCITTEGLMMYLTESEVQAFCQNVHRLLQKYGGCWITADPEISLIYVMALKTVCGERFMEIMMNAKQQTTDKADVAIGVNPLIVKPQSAEDDIKSAMIFLSKCGLKAERIVVADHMPELMSAKEEKAEAFKKAMEKCAFWKITVSEPGKVLDTTEVESNDFSATAELKDGTLFLRLTGRLDTITSPNLLAFYQNNKELIDGVYVDCTDLEYISSAGLRVLLMMQKGSKNGVTLSGITNVVSEILKQTGFDQVLVVE